VFGPEEFSTHGLKYAFPTEHGEFTRDALSCGWIRSVGLMTCGSVLSRSGLHGFAPKRPSVYELLRRIPIRIEITSCTAHATQSGVVEEARTFSSQRTQPRVGKVRRNRSSWGGRRGSNPRHSVPQTDALPAELRPPVADSKQFTLLFPTAKAGSMGPTHEFYCQSKRELKPTHATCKADADALYRRTILSDP
jgi:hypothetical protein